MLLRVPPEKKCSHGMGMACRMTMNGMEKRRVRVGGRLQIVFWGEEGHDHKLFPQLFTTSPLFYCHVFGNTTVDDRFDQHHRSKVRNANNDPVISPSHSVYSICGTKGEDSSYRSYHNL